MNPFQIIGVKSNKTIEFGENVFQRFVDSLREENLSLEDNDILVITSKVVSMEQYDFSKYSDIEPSEEAIMIAKECDMNPKIVQIIMNQSNSEILGYVKNALLTVTPYGIIPNAGVDQSNAPPGHVILLPHNPENYARKFHDRIKSNLNRRVGVLIMDSTVNPLRQGTSGIALSVAGFDPIIDDIGTEDLYGYKMTMTKRAIADNIATSANLVMGETNERIPFAIIRGLEISNSGKSENVKLIPEDLCLFMGPFRKLQEKKL